MKYKLKRPDGTEVTQSQADLTIGYNQGKIDVAWLATPEGATNWKRVGIIIGLESEPPTSPNTPPPLPPSRPSGTSAKQVVGVIIIIPGILISAIGGAHLYMGMGDSGSQVGGLVFGLLLVIGGLAMATSSKKSK